jgi:hypothetical protein
MSNPSKFQKPEKPQKPEKLDGMKGLMRSMGSLASPIADNSSVSPSRGFPSSPNKTMFKGPKVAKTVNITLKSKVFKLV